MAYNKEYYEKHKEQMKLNRQRYREKNKDIINTKQREKYHNLSIEERQERIEKQREKRAKNPEISRIQYRIDMHKRKLRLLETKMFDLQMTDTWDSSDYKYSDELNKKIKDEEKKIKELLAEKEKLRGTI